MDVLLRQDPGLPKNGTRRESRFHRVTDRAEPLKRFLPHQGCLCRSSLRPNLPTPMTESHRFPPQACGLTSACWHVTLQDEDIGGCTSDYGVARVGSTGHHVPSRKDSTSVKAPAVTNAFLAVRSISPQLMHLASYSARSPCRLCDPAVLG